MVTLYSTDCPRCKVLEQKLTAANIEFNINKDINILIEKGFSSAPALEVNGEFLDFKKAVDWVKEQN
jgi:hypothetical protein